METRTIRATVIRDGRRYVAVVPQNDGSEPPVVTCDGEAVDWASLPRETLRRDPATGAWSGSGTDGVAYMLGVLTLRAQQQLVRIRPSQRPLVMEIE
jgi:hypothetical protein